MFALFGPTRRDSHFSRAGRTRYGDLSGFRSRTANKQIQTNEEKLMAPVNKKGIIDKPSNHSVDETMERLTL